MGEGDQGRGRGDDEVGTFGLTVPRAMLTGPREERGPMTGYASSGDAARERQIRGVASGRCSSALAVNAEVSEVCGHGRCQRRNGRRDCRQESIEPHSPGNGQSIVVSYALENMVLSELACLVASNQVPDERFAVISHLHPPYATNYPPYLTPLTAVESIGDDAVADAAQRPPNRSGIAAWCR
jgi:hypothetical protein